MYSLFDGHHSYIDSRSNSSANTCAKTRPLALAGRRAVPTGAVEKVHLIMIITIIKIIILIITIIFIMVSIIIIRIIIITIITIIISSSSSSMNTKLITIITKVCAKGGAALPPRLGILWTHLAGAEDV